MKKTLEYNGKIYKKQRNGYFARNEYILLHRKIWEDANGPIPEGCQIHHKDKIRTNNSLDNLECISHGNHVKHHWLENGEHLRKKVRENITKAWAWRQSKEGQKFYSEHSKDVWKNSPKHMRKCVICKTQFECFERANRKYCSRHCQHEHNKIIYKENRVCLVCGQDFETFKYNRTVTCSKKCRSIKFAETRRLK